MIELIYGSKERKDKRIIDMAHQSLENPTVLSFF